MFILACSGVVKGGACMAETRPSKTFVMHLRLSYSVKYSIKAVSNPSCALQSDYATACMDGLNSICVNPFLRCLQLCNQVYSMVVAYRGVSSS